MEGIIRAVNGDPDGKEIPGGGVDSVFGCLRELEALKGWWNNNKVLPKEEKPDVKPKDEKFKDEKPREGKPKEKPVEVATKVITASEPPVDDAELKLRIAEILKSKAESESESMMTERPASEPLEAPTIPQPTSISEEQPAPTSSSLPQFVTLDPTTPISVATEELTAASKIARSASPRALHSSSTAARAIPVK